MRERSKRSLYLREARIYCIRGCTSRGVFSGDKQHVWLRIFFVYTINEIDYKRGCTKRGLLYMKLCWNRFQTMQY